MPGPDSERPDRIRSIFDAVVNLDPDERAASLAEACGDDEELRREIESLLEAEDARGSEVERALEGQQPSEEANGGGPAASTSGPEEIPTSLQAALADRYTIKRELGRGGMATVYLAEDLKHERKVALKVLRPDLAAVVGATRFLAEIKTTANLQHPHILPLFDSGEADGFLYYVMPYVEGESLRERLDRERQLSVTVAVGIATAVADALAYAHTRGVIHRDIKPSNLLLPAGEPVIADFGIARALDSAGGGRLTQSGLAIGTPAYMSPEQAAGDADVDARSDLYSLGCVLYESLAGEPPFTGRTPQAITARKLTETAPNVTALRETTPPGVAAVIERLLSRVPADRYDRGSAVSGDLRRALTPIATPADPPRARRSPSARATVQLPKWVVWAAVSLMIVMTVRLAAVTLRGSRSDTAQVTWMSITLPEGVRVLRVPGPSMALSPDGRALVFVGRGDEGRQLFIRRFDDPSVRPLGGTSGAASPFFSPSGEWIAFYAEGRIRQIPAAGGAPITIVDAPGGPLGAVWTPDDRIIFQTGYRAALSVVPAGGGAAELLTALDTAAGEFSHRLPRVSPDGRILFYRVMRADDNLLVAQSLESGRRVTVAAGDVALSTATGHVLYSRDETIFGARFDAERLRVQGSFRPLVEGLLSRVTGAVHFDVSASGTLAYLSSGGGPSLVLVESTGVRRTVELAGEAFSQPRFSPDGTRFAVAVMQNGQSDVWIYDLRDGVASRLTLDGAASPVWRPDGTGITYLTGRRRSAGEDRGVITRRLDGLGEERLFPLRDEWHDLGGWTRSGDTLLLDGSFEPGVVIGVAMWDGARVFSVVAPRGPEIRGGRLSPNGRWLAYQSDQTGSAKIYVTSFPDASAPYEISGADGGTDPMWSPDGTELFYVSQERLMAARLAFEPTVRATEWREALDPIYLRWRGDYDVHPDGKTFVLAQPSGAPVQREIFVVQNWLAEVERLIPRQ